MSFGNFAVYRTFPKAQRALKHIYFFQLPILKLKILQNKFLH